jgi:hypothetical protein
MAWELRGFGPAFDAWEAAVEPDASTVLAVLSWVAELLDDPLDLSTTVHVDASSSTRVGCAPGTQVLMRYTLDPARERLIVHRLDSVPEG